MSNHTTVIVSTVSVALASVLLLTGFMCSDNQAWSNPVRVTNFYKIVNIQCLKAYNDIAGGVRMNETTKQATIILRETDTAFLDKDLVVYDKLYCNYTDTGAATEFTYSIESGHVVGEGLL